MNRINLRHAGWADLLDELRSVDPDFDAVARRAQTLSASGVGGPAKNRVLALLGPRTSTTYKLTNV